MIFDEEQDFLQGKEFEEELRRQVILSRDRLLQERREIHAAANDKSIEPDRLLAMNQCYNYMSEIVAAVLRLYAQGPVKVIVNELPSSSTTTKTEALPDRSSSSTTEESKTRIPFLPRKEPDFKPPRARKID
jgi:hypothetical protein